MRETAFKKSVYSYGSPTAHTRKMQRIICDDKGELGILYCYESQLAEVKKLTTCKEVQYFILDVVLKPDKL